MNKKSKVLLISRGTERGCLIESSEHTKRFATKEAVEATGDESEDEDDMSSIDSFSEEEAQDMEL